MNDATDQFIGIMKNPVKFRFFLLTRLPSAFFSGIRLAAVDRDQCAVTVPLTWFTKNPFRSTYFACLSMAAELCSGSLAMAGMYKHRPALSMLIVKLEANYFKKATGRTRFLCTDGPEIRAAIARAIDTGEGQTVRTRSAGTNEAGEPVAEFFFTWSFKVRSGK